MPVIMCLFSLVHPAEIMDLYKERISNDMYAMETQDRYMQPEVI